MVSLDSPVTETYGYDALLLLLFVVSGSPLPETHFLNANGNQLSGGSRTNIWDSQNRMVQCNYNGNITNYTYGADGLRRSMQTWGGITHYSYDGQNVAQEGHLDSGDFVADTSYLTGPRGTECRIDENTGTTR